MRLTILADPSKPHHRKWAEHLGAGLAVAGVECIYHAPSRTPQTVNVACWGWRMGKRFRERGHEVLVMEHGYVGDRQDWTSLRWNGLNGRGTSICPRDIVEKDWAGTRFLNHHPPMAPMSAGPGLGVGYVLLIGQVAGDMSLGGKDLGPWYVDRAKLARSLGYECVFRPHPVSVERGDVLPVVGVRMSTGKSLLEDMLGAVAVYTYNSNTAVDAVLAGVPCVTEDEGSMAWSVTTHDLSDIEPCFKANRREWARDIAWEQWSMHEIRTGIPWLATGALRHKPGPATVA